MSKKFDAEAYVASWDKKVIPAMIAAIVISLLLAIILNVKSRPDCIRHEYVFCGTEEVLEGSEHHGEAAGHDEGAQHAEGAAHEGAHGEAAPAQPAEAEHPH